MLRQWKTGFLLFVAVLFSAIFAMVGSVPKTAHAVNPTTISFQGKVVNADGTNVTDGNYTFLFKLYTVSSAGTAIWTETQSTVAVAAGVFQVNLGSSCPFFTSNACNNNTVIDFNANPGMYLGITFNNDAAGEMTPRVQMQSVPFAYNADKVGGFSAGQLVQLSPGSQQTGSVNVSGSGTFGTSIITPSLAAAGALSISSGSTNNVTIDTGATGGTIAISGTNATSVELSRTGSTTRVKGALQVDQGGTLSGGSLALNFTGTQGLNISNTDMNGTSNGISFVGTPSATAGTTNGLFVQQANSANSNGLDNAITIDNADTNLVVNAAINITNSGGGGYSYLLQSPNVQIYNGGDIVTTGTFQGDMASIAGTVFGGTLYGGTGQLGSLTMTGTATFKGGATIDGFSSGSWINMPTSGPSGIGSGGAGTNVWVGYAAAAGNWFTNSAVGDIAYRNTSGRLLLGTSSGNPQIIVASGSTVFQTTTPLPILTIDNTNTQVQIGSATTDTSQVDIQLDSSSNYTESGTCDTTTAQGSMYYNTATSAPRMCINGGWEDLVSTAGLGILAYGVIADSGAAPGDISNKSSATAAAGPCKAARASATTVTVTACAAYSGGRKVIYAGGTINVSSTNGNWQHICFANAATPFAPTNTLNALTATTTETANLPQWSAANPVVCVADVKGVGGNINIYDTRVFTNTQKSFVNTAAPMALGWIAKDNSATSAATVTLPGTTATGNLRGVIVASGGTTCTSACGPNAILAYSGPTYVKSTSGAPTATAYVSNTGTTSGYAAVTSGTSGTSYASLGIPATSYIATCSSAVNCNLSMLVDLDIR